MSKPASLHPTSGVNPTVCNPAPNQHDQPQPLRILYQNGQPCDEVIATPAPNPLPKKLADKQATKARLALADAKAMSHAAAMLSQYGRYGKPPESYIPPDGDWSSSVPNHHLTFTCASGVYGATRTEWEPRTIINPIKAYRCEQARTDDGFDTERFQSARAIIDRWQFLPWKGCLSTDGQQVWIEWTTETGHWELVADQRAIDEHESTTETPDNVVEPPTINPWLQGAVTRTKGTPAKKKITDEGINDIYETFANDPIAEVGNLQVALHVFAQTHFGKCDNLLRHREGALEPDDMISGFVLDLLERFSKNEYHTHVRRFHHWINRKWSHYYSEQATKYTREQKLTAPVNDTDDYETEVDNRQAGEKFRAEVDSEATARLDQGWNTAKDQVRRLLDDLHNPATFWGQLSEPEKAMIRSMSKGSTQDQAATEAGLTKVKGRRAVRTLREKATADPAIKNSLSRFAVAGAQ